MARQQLEPTATPIWQERYKRWRLYQQHNGERKAFYSHDPSKLKGPAECRRKAREWMNSMSSNDIRFGEAWLEFIEEYKLSHELTSTNQVDSRGKAHLVPRFKHRYVHLIKKSEWQDVIYDAYANGARSKKTLTGIASVIRTFCRWAAKNEYMEDYQIPLVFDFPHNATVGKKTILQPAELRLLFTDNDPDLWYMPMFRFLALTGLRRGELCALQTERDYDGETIHIQESVSHDLIVTKGKTKDADRTIYLGDLAHEQIERHYAMRAERGFECPYLFCSETGKRIPPRVISRRWREWREPNGISITLHELRHTFITYSRKKTSLNLEDLKAIYGHSKSMDTDATYVHEIAKTIEQIEAERERKIAQANIIDDTFAAVISGSQ